MKRTSLFLVAALALSACITSGPYRETSAESSGTVHRFLAWFEGDLQNDYAPNRELARTQLGDWAANPPEITDTDNYLEYLSLLIAAGKTTDSEKKIKEYLTKFPGEKRAVFLLASHYWRVKKKELANYFFNQLEKDSNFAWRSLLLNNLGMVALGDGNRSQAIAYFEKATQSQPAVAAPYVNLGALYLQSRSFKEAENVFKKAYDLDSSFEDAALGLGVALEGQGKFEDAHRVYAAYLEVNPEASSIVYNDAVLLGNRLNQKVQASQLMLRYIQRGGKETAKAQEIIQSWR